MRLSETIKALQQAEADAKEYGREAIQEHERRKKWNEEFNEKIKGNPMLGISGGGVPGFDNDDPTI
jgi:hypothetical protein